MDIVIQVHIKRVQTQPIVQENVPDVLPMVYQQHHIVGQQQRQQLVQQPERQPVPIAAKPRVLQPSGILLAQQQHVQQLKHVHVLDVVQ